MKSTLGQSAFQNFGYSLTRLALLFFLGAAFLAAFYPVWSSLVRAWAYSEDYSHGFAIVPLALFILWQKRETLGREETSGSWNGLVVVVAALFVYLVARAGEILTLGALSLIPFFAGSTLFLFGSRVLRICLFPLALLVFMIPVPAQVMAALTIPLQLLVTTATAVIAGSLGIPMLCEGNVIHLPDRTFEVVQACSGLRSIMTMLTLGAVMAYFTLRSNTGRTVLFVAGVPIAILVNVIRVLVMVALAYQFGLDLSTGTLHTLLGLTVFVLALGLFFLVQKGLARCES